MKDDEPPAEESEIRRSIREWRQTERKKMVETMERLLSQAARLAESRYTRSNQRAKWTRLAGQLLWYKDQILRAMTWEALDQELDDLERSRYKEVQEQKRSSIIRIEPPWAKKQKEKDNKDEKDTEAEPEKQVAC